VVGGCYIVFLVLFMVFASGDRDQYPNSFGYFVMLVGIVIGPNVLFLYDQLIKLQEEVERLKEQIGSKASGGSEN